MNRQSSSSSKRFNSNSRASQHHQQKDSDYHRRPNPQSDGSRQRQLFDPFSDNPIAFNRPILEKQPEVMMASQPAGGGGSRSYLVQRREGFLHKNASSTTSTTGDQQQQQRSLPAATAVERPPKGRLWDPNNEVTKTESSAQPPVQRGTHQGSSTRQPAIARRPLQQQQQQQTLLSNQLNNEEDKMAAAAKDMHKRKIKALFTSLQDIETKITAANTEARQLAFFRAFAGEDRTTEGRRQSYRQSRDSTSEQQAQQQLTESDMIMAESMWHKKMDLHIALANKYLDIIQLDYGYAEKKSLESLCWKRAIYSPVEQFRNALKVRMNIKTDFDDQDQDNVVAESIVDIPVFSDTLKGYSCIEEDEEPVVTKDEELTRLKGWFGEFLDRADDFYRRSMVMLCDLEPAESNEEEHLQDWRRTRRLKWYKAVPNRGDLARYRWSYAADEDGNAYREAWRWYALGVWLMPATGKLYFHLSLLMSGPHTLDPLHDFHRLYFSTRSLMVRRNGFLNAREGMIVLFESNRRWVDKYLKSVQTTASGNGRNRSKKPQQLHQQKQAQAPVNGGQDITAAMFVRLHGMMFTKISLDQFAQIKRRFFNGLFHESQASSTEVKIATEIPSSSTTARKNDGNMTASEMFWFEAAVICLSSLYSYDYASSKLTKLIILQSKRLFGQTIRSEQEQRTDNYDELLQGFSESILFAYDIDLMCGIATELFRRYVDPTLPPPDTPRLPLLPQFPTNLQENHSFIFEPRQPIQPPIPEETGVEPGKDESWMIFIEIVLHWMVVNAVCQRPPADEFTDSGTTTTTGSRSLWESLVGNVASGLLHKDLPSSSDLQDESNIAPAFWPLLLEFLNKLLCSLEDDLKYELVNRFLLEEEDGNESCANGELTPAECAFARLAIKVLGKKPSLPEETHMRGLGWVDDITGRLLKVMPYLQDKKDWLDTLTDHDLVLQRKIKVLSYGFALTHQMSYILCYDPVLEMFSVDKSVEEEVEMMRAMTQNIANGDGLGETATTSSPLEDDNDSTEDQVAPTVAAMDDAVLFSNENDSVDEDGDDDMLTQLKKRREQLQAMLTTDKTATTTTQNRRVSSRLKERETRLKRLRERVIPGQTTIVLDTNCFIGHIDQVQRLIKSDKWLIVIPLVVITELDGLKSNTPPLGTIAADALRFIETLVAAKQQRQNPLRIQTSHNNFMHDISIRSEQFVFGETDKNLDDLVLSACLWWAKDDQKEHARVCLVTGDRNLSVKARARDIDVMSVSAIMQMTPKNTKTSK